MIQILFALLAGILTVAAPCILPVLPILLGSSIGQQNKARPLFIVLGFIITFALASLVISIIVQHIPYLDPNHIRNIAIVLIAIFGLFLIWPWPFEWFMSRLNFANLAVGASTRQGNGGALFIGMSLGIVWAPCAGPILASILALVAIQGNSLRSITLLIAYGLGAGIPMLIIAYGSQAITTKVRSIAQYARPLQVVFGVLILLLAYAMYKNIDVQLEAKLADYFPQASIEAKLVGQPSAPSDETVAVNQNPILNPSTTPSSKISKNPSAPAKPVQLIQLQNYGPAPDFTGITQWLNSQPLSMNDLKGKVVLIDFWTYSCINCIRTLPYVTKWYDNYKDKGFVVIGVHTPEFDFEKVTSNVQNAISRFGINYPVAQDNNYGTWNAYNNEYWPAEYLIDQKGNIVYEDFGEGEYDKTEDAIRQLLSYNTTVAPDNGQDLSGIGSPEMYFEPSRLENLTPDQQPSSQPQSYTFTQNLALNNFALDGLWQFTNDHAELVQGPGKIRLHYRSKNVYMVAASAKPITITISLDGGKSAQLTVQASQLYNLVQSNTSGEHTVEIDIPDAGFQAFTFTFG